MAGEGVSADLLCFLEGANLLCYKEALLEQGADDVEQLKELDEEEFEQLCGMVGMDKKPFHVMRLKKALSRRTATKPPPPIPVDKKCSKPYVVSISPVSDTPPFASTGQSASSGYGYSDRGSASAVYNATPPAKAPSSHSSPAPTAKAPTSHSSPAPTVKVPTSHSSPAPTVKAPTSHSSLAPTVKALTSHSSPAPATSKQSTSDRKPKTLFLPPYLQEDSEGQSFEELIDDQTPVQKTLGPSPFQPSMWDPGRKELIRKYATIYGKNFNRRQKELLTPFEEQVNEGAYQLCLRDPTLLVRREELFILSKRAVKEGGYTYYHGFPKNKESDHTIATTGQKRIRPRPNFDLPAAKILVTSELVEDVPKKMSGRMRQERMTELEKLIAANKTQQEAKLVELEQAQQLCNFSSAFSIQLEVESLGNACQALQTSYASLKRKQRRSDRYYTLKDREDDADMTKGELSPDNNSNGANPTQIAKTNAINKSASLSTVTATIIPGAGGGLSSVGEGGPSASFEDTPTDMEDSEVQDLVKNVSHATDEVNTLMIREFQKQLAWDL